MRRILCGCSFFWWICEKIFKSVCLGQESARIVLSIILEKNIRKVRVHSAACGKSEAGRMDDIVKAALDKAYQESLFEEFQL